MVARLVKVRHMVGIVIVPGRTAATARHKKSSYETNNKGANTGSGNCH